MAKEAHSNFSSNGIKHNAAANSHRKINNDIQKRSNASPPPPPPAPSSTQKQALLGKSNRETHPGPSNSPALACSYVPPESVLSRGMDSKLKKTQMSPTSNGSDQTVQISSSNNYPPMDEALRSTFVHEDSSAPFCTYHRQVEQNRHFHEHRNYNNKIHDDNDDDQFQTYSSHEDQRGGQPLNLMVWE